MNTVRRSAGIRQRPGGSFQIEERFKSVRVGEERGSAGRQVVRQGGDGGLPGKEDSGMIPT